MINVLSWKPSTLVLRDFWLDKMPLNSGDDLTIIGQPSIDSQGRWLIDNQTSSAIVVRSSEISISCTRIASASECLRRSVLQERIKLPYSTIQVSLIGTIFHSVAQHALNTQDFTNVNLDSEMKRLIGFEVMKLIELDLDETFLFACVKFHVERLKQWASTYFPTALNDIQPLKTFKSDQPIIERVLATEEPITSLELGISGE